jgi:hypothetical protein
MTKHEVNAGVLSVCAIGLLVAGISLAIDQMGDLALVAAIVVAVPTAIGLACIVVRDIGRVRRVRRKNEKRPPIGPTAEEVARNEMAKRLAGWPQSGRR